MSGKAVKRPLLFANLLIIAVTMTVLEMGYKYEKFPRVKSWEGEITGEICAIEEKENGTEIILKNVDYSDVENLEVRAFLTKGVIFRRLKTKCLLSDGNLSGKIGQTVTVNGKFCLFEGKTNPGQFDMRKYYLSKGIILKGTSCRIVSKEGRENCFSELLRTVRKYLMKKLDEALNEGDAGLMKAILLADKSDVEADTKELYQTAGASHILAISGLHISLLGAGILFLLQWLPISKTATYAASSGALFLYGFMIGFSPSSLRAIIMFSILSLGKVLNRSYDPVTAMSSAAVLTLVLHPLSCLQSGFIMSYLAIVGLTVFVPAFAGDKKNKMSESIKGGIAVTLYTFPAVINSYYRFPLYSVLLNLILVPCMTVVLCAGFLCIIWEAVFPKTFNIFAFFVHIIFKAYEIIMALSLKLPFSSVLIGGRNVLSGVIFLFLLTLICVLLKKYRNELYRRRKVLSNQKRMHPSRNMKKPLEELKKREKIIKIAAALAIAVDVFLLIFDVKNDKVTFLDVGQGLCTVMEIGGKTYLFDGGSSDKRDVWKYVIKPFLLSEGKDSVEIWFVSHSDNDHVSGLKDALTDDDVKIKRICMNDFKDKKADEIKKTAANNNIQVYTAHAGQRIEADSAVFEIRAPKAGGYKGADVNENSLVVMVKTDCGNILLPGDAGYDAEEDAVGAGENVTVYQAAHHGSAKDGNSEDFIKKMHPLASVISCGFDNPYGHPHDETLERLQKYSKAVFRTDEDGAVTVILKNKEMQIFSFL